MPPVRFVPNTDAPTHLGNFRDVVELTGVTGPGVPLLPDELGPPARLVVEFAWGADLDNSATWHWTDHTGVVRMAEKLRIKIGRADEGTQAEYAECQFFLDNSAGNFTPELATGAYYPYVRRNTPVRVTINTGTGDNVRFLGYATEFTPAWDETGNLAIMGVTAAGLFRRLAQGDTPKLSSMRRSFDSDTVQPVAYWPLEEGSDATVAYDVITGAPSVVGGFTGLVDDNAGKPLFGVADLGPGSDAVANIAGGWNLDLNLPSGIVATGQITLQTSMAFGTTVRTGGLTYSKTGIRHNPTTNAKHLGWNVFAYDDGFIALFVFEADQGFNLLSGPTTLYGAGAENLFDGQPRQFQLDLTANGGTDVDWVLYENDELLSFGTHTPSFSGAMNAPPYRVALNSNVGANETSAIGHVAVFTTNISPERYTALSGHRGETATDRLVRLCAEEGVGLDLNGSSDTAMGSQSVESFINLLRECETADHGILYDGFGSGLGYVARSSLYNETASLTVDMTQGQVAPPFEPRYDDQRIINKFTAYQKDGASAVFEDSTGPLGTTALGIYDSSATYNIDSATEVVQHAAWSVHLGTVEGLRYPTLNLNLRSKPELIPNWIETPLLGRIDVSNVSSRLTQHPAGIVSLLLEGYTEVITPLEWTVEANCSPYEPYAVGVLDSSDFRLDCGASTLATAIDSTQTSISVKVGDSCFWTHASGDYDVSTGGEEMIDTAVGAASSPQALTVTRSVNGVVKTHSGGAQVHVVDSFVLAL